MKLIPLLILPFLICSCANGPNRNPNAANLGADGTMLSELTIEQESAFEALTTLQLRSDKRNQLYSTFANIDQPCYPPDTSFVISQAQFHMAMKQFISRHYSNLTVEQQDALAEKSVKAQEKYQILHCRENSENELPMTGTWVIPNILGRSDVILHW